MDLASIDVKTYLTIAASILTVAVGGTYVYRAITIPHKVPHVISWALLTLLTGTACAVQFAAGAGFGTIVLLLTTLFNFTNFIVGVRKRGKHDITGRAILCAALAVVAIVLWRISGNPTIAAVFLTIASLIAFAPTVMRTWKEPHAEVQGTYWVNTFRYMLATLAVSKYSWATMLYPGAWIAVNGLFSLYHIYCLRRWDEHQKNHLAAISN